MQRRFFSLFKSSKTIEPLYLTGKYPHGFNILDPIESLTKSYAAIVSIGEQLKKEVEKAKESPDWTNDKINAVQILSGIKHINLQVSSLKEQLNYLNKNKILLSEGESVIPLINLIQDAANSAFRNLKSPYGPETLNALNALADVLHITYQSIPKLSILQEFRQTIKGYRFEVLELIKEAKANILVNVNIISADSGATTPGTPSEASETISGAASEDDTDVVPTSLKK